MTDQEEQEDEILALSSIYDNNILKVTRKGELNGGELSAHIVLPDDFCVKMVNSQKESSAEKGVTELHKIQHLPPVLLKFVLPKDYPSSRPPQFTLSCKWLNRQQLGKLCKKLDSMWEENKGCVVLFIWNTFLQDELFDYLALCSPLELDHVINPTKDSDIDKRAIPEVSSQNKLLPEILVYNKQEKYRQLEKSSFVCEVCFIEKAGVNCTMFYDCDHVYCNDCMTGYFSVQIKEGNVKGLECPHDKCESQAHPTQVKKLVTPDLFQKYDRLLFQITLDTMPDVTFCPRPKCQTPVLIEKETILAICPYCEYAFCTVCRVVYHGISPCKLKADSFWQKLREEYQDANLSAKKFLEKRYGKIRIQKALEEGFTNEWLEQNTKQCPGCGAFTQKIEGCNKMHCIKCKAHFCWLCNSLLSRTSPYRHYLTDDGSQCYRRLFEGEDVNLLDEVDEDWE